MNNIDYTNSLKYNYNIGSFDIKKYKEMAKNINQYTFWNFSELSNFILHNYKQLLLFAFIFIIIIVIERITVFNSLMFTSPSAIPGLSNIPAKKDKKKK
jgi:ascorbate-specific PTS system EIIC-type component UlaA